MPEYPHALTDLAQFPLMQAIFGRRARRFGLATEIPSGPLAFKSPSRPVPLSDLEQALLVAAGTGVSGWNFGIPFVLTGFVQAQHIETGYYDKYFQPGAYLDTQAEHMKRWHGDEGNPDDVRSGSSTQRPRGV